MQDGGTGEERSSGAPGAQRKPPWLRISLEAGRDYAEIKKLLRAEELHTVCEEARCPKLHERWGTPTSPWPTATSSLTAAPR